MKHETNTKREAVVILDADSVDVYFLAIDLEKGTEICRYSTQDFGTFKCDDLYSEADILKEISEKHGFEIINKIYWAWIN